MFNWFAFLTYAVITAATPGPNNINVHEQRRQARFKGALPFNFGILAGFAAVMLICTAFAAPLQNLYLRLKRRCLLPALHICFIWHGQLIKAMALLVKTTRAAAFIPALFCSLSTLKFTFTALCPCRPTFCRFTSGRAFLN